MGASTTISERVLAWRGLALKVRESLGMTEKDVPLFVVIALIAEESSGDPTARRSGSQYRGLLQIGDINAEDIGNRVPEQFDGNNANIKPLGVEGDFIVANPERVAAENSLIHFYEHIHTYRRRIGGDPFRMAMSWKAGPSAVRRFNEAVGPPEQVSAGSQAGLEYFKQEENNSDAYLRDVIRLFPEAQEKLGQAPTIDVSSISGARVTRRTSDRSPYSNSTSRISTKVPASPGCPPESQRRYIPPSPERQQLASTVKRKTLQATEFNYVKSIQAYLSDIGARIEAGRDGYTREAETNVRTFLQEVEDDEEQGVAGALKAAFAFTPANFVKPLEVFDVREPFGKARNRLPTGEEVVRRHLGVDLETRDPAQKARDARTAEFISNPSQPPTNLFGQKPVYAIADGEVISAGLVGFYGLVVFIAHEGGVTSRYAHLSKIDVSVGDQVSKAQPIGVSGTTEEERNDGEGTGRPDHSAVRIPHLHFEIRVNIGALRGQSTSLTQNTENVALDPAAVLAQAPGPLDPPQIVSRPEEKAIDESRGIQASLLVNAETDHGRLKNEEAYDAVTAQQRSQKVRNMTRADYYTEQSRVAPISRNVQEQAVSVSPQANEAFSAEPLAANAAALPESETGLAEIADQEIERKNVRVNDQFDVNQLSARLDDRITTISARLENADTQTARAVQRKLNLVTTIRDQLLAGAGDVIAEDVTQGDLSARLVSYEAAGSKVHLLEFSDGSFTLELKRTFEATV